MQCAETLAYHGIHKREPSTTTESQLLINCNVALCTTETWILTKADHRLLEAFIMNLLETGENERKRLITL